MMTAQVTMATEEDLLAAADEIARVEETKVAARVGRPRALLVAVIALTVLLVGGGVAAWLQISRLTHEADLRTSAADVGPGYAAAFLSYDHRDSAGSRARIAPHLTERFAAEYAAAMDQLEPVITETQAVVEASVIGSAVVSTDDTKAVLLVFLDQTTTNTSTPKPRLDRSRFEVTLQRAGDEWRLDTLAMR